MNLPTLIDVALGLALVFFILASIGSVLAELWAAHRKLRHRLLKTTVNRLLGPDIAEKFWQHSLILPLYEPPPEVEEIETESEEFIAKAKVYAEATLKKTGRVAAKLSRFLVLSRRAEAPDYLDSQLFATVVLDLASGRGALGPIPNDRASWEATIKANIAEIVGEDNDLQDHLLALLRQLPAATPDTAGALKASVSKWYEEAMQRASSVYRRKTQRALLVIGLVLALGLNVDAVRMAQILYLNPQLRSDVAAQAVAVAEDAKAASTATVTGNTVTTTTGNSTGTGNAPASGNQNPAGNQTATPAKTPREQLRESAGQLRDLAKVGFPLGWQDPWKEGFLFLKNNEPTGASWLAKIFGLAASALAVCLGAPFWFDVIGRLVKLRSSAGSEAEKPKSASAGAGTPAAGVVAAPAVPPAAPAAPNPLPAATTALATTATGCDLARAYWLAEFADHAYERDPALLTGWLAQQGFTLTKSFNDATTDTQGFLATAGNLAVLAFRGTEKELKDWLTDAKAEQITDPNKIIPGRLHQGFITAYNSVAADVASQVDAIKAAGGRVHLTGHSLGAALATLAALHLEARPTSAGSVATVHTFGSPRVGDPTFAASFERSLRGRVWRFVNNEDIVTRIPPPKLHLEIAGKGLDFDYEHVGEMKFIDAQGHIMGDVSFMFRLLNFTTNALGDFREAVATTLKDHSMQFYCAFLRRGV
jgi:triacylglycerol lipase